MTDTHKTIQKFSSEPQFAHDLGGRYIGTWYYHDAYVMNCPGDAAQSLLLRYGDKPHEYGSMPCLGWNPFHPTQLVGDGKGTKLSERMIEGDHFDRAQMCALAYLGRELLDNRSYLPR